MQVIKRRDLPDVSRGLFRPVAVSSIGDHVTPVVIDVGNSVLMYYEERTLSKVDPGTCFGVVALEVTSGCGWDRKSPASQCPTSVMKRVIAGVRAKMGENGEYSFVCPYSASDQRGRSAGGQCSCRCSGTVGSDGSGRSDRGAGDER